jgi:hypothetical protein
MAKLIAIATIVLAFVVTVGALAQEQIVIEGRLCPEGECEFLGVGSSIGNEYIYECYDPAMDCVYFKTEYDSGWRDGRRAKSDSDSRVLLHRMYSVVSIPARLHGGRGPSLMPIKT